MFHFMAMVTDLAELNCYNTDEVSVHGVLLLNIILLVFYTDNGALTKVPIGRVENGSLTLDNNESDSTVFPGIFSKIHHFFSYKFSKMSTSVM